MTLIEAIEIVKKLQILYAAKVPCELIGGSLTVKDIKVTNCYLTVDAWSLSNLREFVK